VHRTQRSKKSKFFYEGVDFLGRENGKTKGDDSGRDCLWEDVCARGVPSRRQGHRAHSPREERGYSVRIINGTGERFPQPKV